MKARAHKQMGENLKSSFWLARASEGHGNAPDCFSMAAFPNGWRQESRVGLSQKCIYPDLYLVGSRREKSFRPPGGNQSF